MYITFLIPLLTLFAAPSPQVQHVALFSYQYPSAHRVLEASTLASTTQISTNIAHYISTSRTRLARRATAPVKAPTATTSASTTTPPTSSQPKPDPTPKADTPTNSNTSTNRSAQAIEEAVVRLTNAERTKAGLTPFVLDTTLTTIARAHSLDMRTKKYFSHTNLDGCSSSCRATNAGYQWRSIAENIYWMSGYSLSNEAAAEKIVNGWMNSPGHRANMLGKHAEIGVGIDISDSRVTATANYGTER